MKRSLGILFFVFLCVLSQSAFSQTNIAVLEFLAKGITPTAASILTDRLRIELVKQNNYKVVEREMMDDILREQGFQQTGCTTDECIVAIGRLVGVEQMIGGSISKLGNIYSVAARIVSVETGEILKIATYDHEGRLEDLLKYGMADVAKKLTGLSPGKPPAPQKTVPVKKPRKPSKPRQTKGPSFVSIQIFGPSAGIGIDLDLVLDDHFCLGGGWGFNPFEVSGMPNLHATVYLGGRRPVYIESGAMWFYENSELDTEGLYYLGAGYHYQKPGNRFRVKIGGMIIFEPIAGEIYPWGGLSLGYNL
ncbi:hypothetical protein EH223_07090 [candidate division KSB1 bacterium]|nr:MAG: hypothetical protein EH223_07090 [candidate division KSB1 bacterium]